MGNENFIKSIGFQFADTELAEANYFDHTLVWTPKRPKSPQPIKNRWIYAFAFVDGQKAILDAEYYADGQGSLTYLPGKTRRSVEPTNAPRRGTPMKEAWVKNVILKQVYKYAFVATRGRMGLDAISDMENALHPIYERMNLADLSHFQDGADQKKYLAIIDPLVIALKLSEGYQMALNEAINYVIAHQHNPNKADVEVRNRKVQLAKMIKKYLMEPREGQADPLDVFGHLDGGGATLESYLSDKESELRKKKWAAKNAARDLILFLESVALLSRRWYCGTLQALELVGPVWLDAMGSCLSRLSETEEGRDYQQYLIGREEYGIMGYLFEPDDEKDRTDIRKQKLLAMRKAVTGFVIGFGEMAPALIVHSKVRAATRQKIIKSIKGFLTHTELKWVERNRAGQVTHMMRMSRTSFHLEIEVGHAEADIKEWIEQGKPHWEEGTRSVEKADQLGKILQVIEFINFYYYMTKLGDEGDPVQHAAEFFGATLDFVAAMEDPIRALAKAKDAAKAAGRGEGAALEAAGAEIRGPWTKLAAPAVFKILGGVSAAIDTWYNYKDAEELRGKGNAALARAKETIAGGSALIVAASVFNAVGYMTEIAILTAASATFLVFGIVLVTIGYVLVALFTTSPWQIYASHCCFGKTPIWLAMRTGAAETFPSGSKRILASTDRSWSLRRCCAPSRFQAS